MKTSGYGQIALQLVLQRATVFSCGLAVAILLSTGAFIQLFAQEIQDNIQNEVQKSAQKLTGAPVPTSAALQIKKPTLEAPTTAKQGETVFITLKTPAGFSQDLSQAHARLAGKSVPIFRQPSGTSGTAEYWALLPLSVTASVGTASLSIVDATQTVLLEAPIQITNAHFSRQNIGVSGKTQGLQPEPGELETVAALKTILTPTRYWQKPFVLPVTACMNSPFGVLRYHNGVYTGDYHKGIDQKAPQGQVVLAPAAGVVQIARKYRLHGGTVGLDHGQGVSSIYIHLSAILVKPGQHVAQGEPIARVGSTGFATGPHLHWGVYVNGLPVNPLQWLPPLPRC